MGALFFPPGFRGPRWPNGALGAHRTGFSGRSLRPHRADRTDQPRPDLRPRARSGTRLRPRRRTRLRRAGRGARLRRTRWRTRGAGGRTRRPTELVKAAAGITFHRASFLRRKRDADFRRQKARTPLYAEVRRRVSGGAGGSDSSCGVALVHYGLLAQRSPHPSASRPPSPSGKALTTLYKLKCCIFLRYTVPLKAFPWGEGGPAQAGSDEGHLPNGIARVPTHLRPTQNTTLLPLQRSTKSAKIKRPCQKGRKDALLRKKRLASPSQIQDGRG